MRQDPRTAVLVVPGSLQTRTGGYLYDRRMIDGLRRRGWSIDVIELDDRFPTPGPAALRHAAAAMSDLEDGALVLVDGLALGAMHRIVRREAARLRLVAIVHLPLAADVAVNEAVAAKLRRCEGIALAAVRLVIVTGRATLPMLQPYALDPRRITLIEPGTDQAPLARRSGGPTLELLSVATLGPAKGHDVLLRALAAVPYRNWRLVCAGSLTRHPDASTAIRQLAVHLGVADRVDFAGDLDRPALAARYARADVFVLATRQETYGMAVAEALACGLPVVATRTGAIPDLVGETAGLLVPVGDEAALTGALTRVLSDAGLRHRLAAGARRARARLPSWDQAANRLAGALSALDRDG